jgi:hypothetical protein
VTETTSVRADATPNLREGSFEGWTTTPRASTLIQHYAIGGGEGHSCDEGTHEAYTRQRTETALESFVAANFDLFPVGAP